MLMCVCGFGVMESWMWGGWWGEIGGSEEERV